VAPLHHLPVTATSDFDAAWAAARALRAGADAYAAIQSPPWPWTLQYPLPAVLLAAPFSVLPLDAARAAFMAVSVGLLAFGLTRRAWWPLIALLAADAHRDVLGSMDSVADRGRPVPMAGCRLGRQATSGAALFAAYPDRRAVVGGLVLLALAFAASRTGWRAGAWSSGRPQLPAILRLGGVVLLLGLLRWRLPEGRQLAVLALVPLSPHLYEAVLSCSLPDRGRELALTVCGTLGGIAGALWPPTHVPTTARASGRSCS